METCLLQKLENLSDGANFCPGKTRHAWPGLENYCLLSVCDLMEEKDDAGLNLGTSLVVMDEDEAGDGIHQRGS